MKKRIYTAPKMGTETIVLNSTLCASGGDTGSAGVIVRTKVDLSSIWI